MTGWMIKLGEYISDKLVYSPGFMWSLNVSTITGPPYAIFDINPKLGPLTGKTKVSIKGDGFTDS